MKATLPGFVNVPVPPWLWGGNPADFFTKAALHARRVEGPSGLWRVKTAERQTRVRPGVIEVHHLAGPRQRSAFTRLETFVGPPVRGPLSEREAAEVERRADRALETRELVDCLSTYTLQTLVAEQRQLPQVVGHVHDELRSFRIEGSTDQAFPDSGVTVVRRRPELLHRLKLAAVFARPWPRVGRPRVLRL